MDCKISTEFLIQTARPCDLPGIVALRERNLRRYMEKDELPLSTHHETLWRRCAEAIASPFARVDVVLDGAEVVGCLFLRLTENPLNSQCLIALQEVFVIEPSHRGQGLGRALLERGEKWARDHQAEAIGLACHTGEDLDDWFMKHGYPAYETFRIKRLE